MTLHTNRLKIKLSDPWCVPYNVALTNVERDHGFVAFSDQTGECIPHVGKSDVEAVLVAHCLAPGYFK